MNTELADPGHERVEDYGDVKIYFDADGLATKAVIRPAQWRRAKAAIRLLPGLWIDYRASLLARSALADTLSEWQKLRLSLELLAVTGIIGIGWTLWVLGVLVLAGAILGIFI